MQGHRRPLGTTPHRSWPSRRRAYRRSWCSWPRPGWSAAGAVDPTLCDGADPATAVAVPVHISPVCPQNEEARQKPAEQRPEQHSAPSVQSLFSVLQSVLSGWQVTSHLPLQQPALLAHAWLSGVQAGRLRLRSTHVAKQQSAGATQAAPVCRQVVSVLVVVVVRPCPRGRPCSRRSQRRHSLRCHCHRCRLACSRPWMTHTQQ